MKLPGISENLPQLSVDKANHFVYGVIIFVAFAAVLGANIALLLVALVAVAKEAYDGLTATGSPDMLDALATLTGGAAGFICTLF